MNIKETFLKLTEYTIPFKHESDIEKLLPPGIKKDKIGNYYIKIGNSETLFTSHLDNFCHVKQKVNHIIKGNIISTDGTTILGGDNKAGVTVLLYLISKNVPGTYFFFIGEEPIGESGGLYGSSLLAKYNPKFCSSFRRAISFDRKQKGSIITRQLAEDCCSDSFANSLIDEFKKLGMNMKKDKTGYYTDTASFINLIPECTNISVGVWNEHHNEEYVDISYVEKISICSSKINWENLPSVRNPKPYVDEKEMENKEIEKNYNNFHTIKIDNELFRIVSIILENEDFLLKNKYAFIPGKEMIFNKWFEETPLKIKIYNGDIFANDKKLDLNFKRNYSKKYIIKSIKYHLMRIIKIK